MGEAYLYLRASLRVACGMFQMESMVPRRQKKRMMWANENSTAHLTQQSDALFHFPRDAVSTRAVPPRDASGDARSPRAVA